MKNVEVIDSGRVAFRVRPENAPPIKGWAVRYLSGMEEASDVKPGYWLSRWQISDGYFTFNFERELDLHFGPEAEATRVSKTLRESAEIETEVVRLG